MGRESFGRVGGVTLMLDPIRGWPGFPPALKPQLAMPGGRRGHGQAQYGCVEETVASGAPSKHSELGKDLGTFRVGGPGLQLLS